MGASESSEKIDKLRSKTFRKTLDRSVVTLNELKTRTATTWEPINVVLHDGILSTYISNNLENSIELNKSTYINLNKHNELILAMNLDNYLIWKFRANEPNTLQEWQDLLIMSKRPRFLQSEKCQNCQAVFTSFRRKHHCRNCGRILCQECSPFKVLLDAMGFKSKKRVCLECYDSIKSIKIMFESD